MNRKIQYWIGIDPGKKGAIAIISDNEIKIYDTPITKIKKNKKNKTEFIESQMVNILSKYKYYDAHIIIEKVHSMPKQGVVAMFSMGKGYGLWKGIIATLKIPYTEVSPQSWKKKMMQGMGKIKSASCYRAQQLFPHVELFGFRGGAKDGRGDALLMAEYGRLIYG